eukprot:234351_1
MFCRIPTIEDRRNQWIKAGKKDKLYDEKVKAIQEWWKEHKHQLNDCGKAWFKKKTSKPLFVALWNREVQDGCGGKHIFQDLLITKHKYYYSLCIMKLAQHTIFWHCVSCGKCRHWREEHCETHDTCECECEYENRLGMSLGF